MASRLVLVLADLFIPDLQETPHTWQDRSDPLPWQPYLPLRLRLPPPTRARPSAGQGRLRHPPRPVAAPSQGQNASGAQAGAAPEATFPIPTALSKVVTHGSLRIGFTHGDTILPPGDPDALLIAARQMDVDVLCWAGTCKFEAYEMEGKFFINPGSARGAVSWLDETLGSEEDGVGDGDGTVPSFVLMDVQGDVLILYVYQLRKDAEGKETVGVDKVSFRKNAAGT
ncbi:Vacuolar protein sorting-associated protein 29 [Friedmanniomyces endolithicus]|nr:Vacuolar protein sorting-associated protein 29 [Friedmanniomyces endolithicus]